MTVVLEMEVQELRDDSDKTEPVTEEVAIHNSMLPGISWGLESGGHAYLALGSENLEREMVLYALIKSPDSQHFFAGECQYQALTEPLLGLLGDRFDPVLDDIVGITDADEILAYVLPSPSE